MHQAAELRLWLSGLVLLLALSGVAGLASEAQIAPGTGNSVPPQRAAHDWAEDAAAKELLVIDLKASYVRYRLHATDSHGDTTRDTFESTDGPVARLILRDGKPLTPAEDAAERSRLQGLLDDPAAYSKHVKNDSAGKRTAADLIKLLPEAMLYTYAPGQPQRTGAAGEVVLDYTPNPAWKPPTTVSEALTGLQGRLWIDPRSGRMTRVEGSVFRTVSMGYGVLAKVNPGGTYAVEQVPVSGERWIVSRFSEHFNLRALMVKSIHENNEVDASGFVPVQGVDYKEAIRILLATPLPQ